jgi:hypothetical protein
VVVGVQLWFQDLMRSAMMFHLSPAGKGCRMKKAPAACFAAMAMLSACMLCSADTTDNQAVTVKNSGFIAFENGQIVKGISGTSNQDWFRGWLERAMLQFTSEFTVNEKIKFFISVESQMGFSYPQSIGSRESMLPRFWMYPARVEGMYTPLGTTEKPVVQFGLGYFPYQFNRKVRNLGEFMFRSGTYPPYILNNFNMPFTRLLGFRVSSVLFENLKQDLFFTSEAQIFPTQDFSLSYVAHYTLANCLEIGAGVCFAHLISIEGRLTSPTQFPDSLDPTRFTDIWSWSERNPCMYLTPNGDTTYDTAYYTFRGTKPCAMLAFDPKPLLPKAIADLLGREDACLYGEICVIGWKNYKNYNPDTTIRYPDFHNRWDRTPFMFGVNIPAFKLLDVLSLEFEHYSNKYCNSYKNVIDVNIPAYFSIPGKKLAAWKWSLYAKKTFLDKFSLIGQVARDHMRPSYPSYSLTERDDVLARTSDWWWVLRLMVKY